MLGLRRTIKLKNEWKRRNGAEISPYITVTAFDVDKFHGGVYIITSDKRFFRIEKCRNDQKVMNEDDDCKECWFEKANAKFPDTFVYEQRKWTVTHEVSLHDVLPDGVPLGICNVRYDSVTGRII